MEWNTPPDILQQLKQGSISGSQEILLQSGNLKAESSAIEQSPDTAGIKDTISTVSQEPNKQSVLQPLKSSSVHPKKSNQEKKKECVTAEYPRAPKQMTSIDKLNFCKNDFQPLKLSRTLGVGLTSNERGFSGYSKEQLKEITQQLWYPIETDLQGSDLSCSNGCLESTESNSWFSNRVLEVKNQSCARTCFPSSTCFPVERMEQEDIRRKELKKKRKKVMSPNLRFVKCCEFPVTKRIGGTMYARICDNVLLDGETVCPKHKGKKEPVFDSYWADICNAIIPKCGTGISPDRSRKGLKCGDFCAEGEQYCSKHSRTSRKAKNAILRCIKVRARPNTFQKRTLEKWFGDKRKTYNLMVEERLEKQFEEKVSISDKTAQESVYKKKYVTECEEYLKDTPKDIRSNAIEEYFTGVCNAFNRHKKLKETESWKEKNWEKYTPREIKLPTMNFQRKKEQQSVTIPYSITKAVSLESELGSKHSRIGIRVYPTFLKTPILLDRRARRNKTLKSILPDDILYDYKLLKTKSGKYYFCFPYQAKIVPTHSSLQASCDGGVRNFQTVYSPQGVLEQYGNYSNRIIRLYQNEIKVLKKEYFKGSLKYDNKLRKYRNLLQEKLRNMITDLHLKTANSLCSKYSTIILPHYGVQSMVCSKSIGPTTKRETLALSHAEFRKRLISKAELRAVTLLIPRNETGTTKTCGICFTPNETVGSSEVFSCSKCGLKAGRDVNAPRNIFIRQLEFSSQAD